MFDASGCDCIAEYLSAIAQGTMCRFECAPIFDSANQCKYLGCSYFSNWTHTYPRKNVAFEAPNDAVAVVCGQIAKYFESHSRATTSKLLAALSARANFCALRFSLGSMPSASSLRAVSRRSRASFRGTSG
jgi:hypothetical protein